MFKRSQGARRQEHPTGGTRVRLEKKLLLGAPRFFQRIQEALSSQSFLNRTRSRARPRTRPGSLEADLSGNQDRPRLKGLERATTKNQLGRNNFKHSLTGYPCFVCD